MVQLSLGNQEAGHLWSLVPLSLLVCVALIISQSRSLLDPLNLAYMRIPGTALVFVYKSPVGFTAYYCLLHFLVFP